MNPQTVPDDGNPPAPVVDRRRPRTDDRQIRCRQCGKPCSAHGRGPAFDRFCRAHGQPCTRAELPVVLWATGAPFARGRRSARTPVRVATGPVVDANELRTAISRLDLTHKELACEIGVSRWTVRAWLSGRNRCAGSSATAIRALVAAKDEERWARRGAAERKVPA